MDYDTEILHMIMQAVKQQMGDLRLVAFGHVIDYNPNGHLVRLMLPAYPVLDSVGNLTGDYAVTGWVQLVSWGLGNGGGFQVAPHVGDMVNKGDQCILLMLEKDHGTAVVLGFCYNDGAPIPFGDLQQGEWGYKHESKTFIRFSTDSSVNLQHKSGSAVFIDKNGNVSITSVQGTVTVQEQNAGSSVVLDTSGNVKVTAGSNGQVILAGGGPGIARIGDMVNLQTGLIVTGSGKANCG